MTYLCRYTTTVFRSSALTYTHTHTPHSAHTRDYAYTREADMYENLCSTTSCTTQHCAAAIFLLSRLLLSFATVSVAPQKSEKWIHAVSRAFRIYIWCNCQSMQLICARFYCYSVVLQQFQISSALEYRRMKLNRHNWEIKIYWNLYVSNWRRRCGNRSAWFSIDTQPLRILTRTWRSAIFRKECSTNWII